MPNAIIQHNFLIRVNLIMIAYQNFVAGYVKANTIKVLPSLLHIYELTYFKTAKISHLFFSQNQLGYLTALLQLIETAQIIQQPI